MTDVVYLDNNATTAVAPEVREAIDDLLREIKKLKNDIS